MGKVIFIIGGARSGKSRFALRLADEGHGEDRVSAMRKKVYIATGEAYDDEMKERIEKHRRERSMEWKTIEEPLEIARVIKERWTEHNVMLIDCLTLWLSNLLTKRLDAIEKEIERFLDAVMDFKEGTPTGLLFIVSNEVGLGIVPENALSRRFRDLAGYLNQKVAEIADEVYLVMAGIPLRIK